MSAFGHQVKGSRAFGAGDFAGAALAFRAAAQEDPSNVFAWLMLARSLEGQGQIQEAQQAAEHALSLSPEDFWTLQASGSIAAQSGDHARARMLTAKAIERYPPNLVPLPGWLIDTLQFVLRLPGAKRMVRAGAVDELSGRQTERELSQWKLWADDYIRQATSAEDAPA